MSKTEKIESDDGKKFILSEPPAEVFLYRKHDAGNHQTQNDPKNISASQNEKIPILDESKGYGGVTYPETGGMYVWHVGRVHPRKGHVYGRALRDCYYPKRILISFLGFLSGKPMIPFLVVFGLMPKKLKGKILTRAIDSYLNIVDEILNDHYLHPQFNIDMCRGLSQPIMNFLVELGVEDVKAARMSLALITLLEYDMAYRLRIEDLLSETTKEKIIADPVGEAMRLIAILEQRDPTRPHLVKKFASFAKLIKYGFWFIRKPFRKAMEVVNFKLLQLDEIDRYQVMHWTGYNWFGMTIEERVAKWPPKPYPAYVLKRIEEKTETEQ